MSKEQFENELLYETTLAVARTMLARGIITDTELSIIDTMLRVKYRPLLGGLYPR